MDDELNLEELATTNSDVNDESIFSLPDTEFNLSLRVSSFNSAKDFDNFIKNVERMVRYSGEYKLWVKYITDHLGHSHCALTNESINECSLEVHHHPITLYVIVKAIVNDALRREQEFSSFDIAVKVIETHFQNKVGYIVLLSDLHKKYHSGFLNLPIELVNGEYRYIMNHYNLEENEYDKVVSLCGVHMDDVQQKWKKNEYPGIENYSDEADPHKLTA